MLGFNVYEPVSSVDLALSLIYLLELLLVILFMSKICELIPGHEKKEPLPDLPLCRHCKYVRIIKEDAFISYCFRYEPKPKIQLRKLKPDCPIDKNQFVVPRKAKYLKLIKRNADIIVLIALIILIYLFILVHEIKYIDLLEDVRAFVDL